MASSHHVGAAAAVSILQLEFMWLNSKQSMHKFVGSNFNQSEFKKINFGTYATDFFILEPMGIHPTSI